MTTQPHWYLVQSQPNAERKAQTNLEQQGYQTYMPRYLSNVMQS